MPKVIRLKNDTYLYGTIIEEGSNSNGSWIKYSSGTMICMGYIKFELDNTDWNAWGNLYSVDKSLSQSFPASFIDTPHISGTNILIRNNMWVARIIRSNSSITSVTVVRPTVPSSGSYSISYTAIGKWK